VTKLEEAVTVLSEGFHEIANTVKGAKWAVLLIFGLVQPIAIAVAIHFLTR
jgi:phage-related minor tail protein